MIAPRRVAPRSGGAKFAKEVWMESVDGCDRRPTLCAEASARNRSSVIVLLARNECSAGMIVWPRMRGGARLRTTFSNSISVKALTNYKNEAIGPRQNQFNYNQCVAIILNLGADGGGSIRP